MGRHWGGLALDNVGRVAPGFHLVACKAHHAQCERMVPRSSRWRRRALRMDNLVA